jgi:hypothetical protein
MFSGISHICLFKKYNMYMATEIIAFTMMVGTAQAGIGADTPSVAGLDGVGRQVTAVGGTLACPQADIMAGPEGNREHTLEITREALPTAVHQVGMVVDMRVPQQAMVVDMQVPQQAMGEDLGATARTTNHGLWDN